MKLGIIRCQQTEHLCPGTKCLQGAQHHLYNFEQFKDEPIELIGMVSCGGCPASRSMPAPPNWSSGGQMPLPWQTAVLSQKSHQHTARLFLSDQTCRISSPFISPIK